MKTSLSGNSIAIVNFILWGLLPLYYHFVFVDNILELFAIRVVASIPILWLVRAILGKPQRFMARAFEKRRSFILVAIASLSISVSWCVFTYAIANNHVLAASLGFFIAPLFAFAFGILIHKDKLSPWQGMAIILAIIGVSYQIFFHGEIPLASLVMAASFSFYGLCKKNADYDMIDSLTLETYLILPFCLGYLGYIFATGQSQLAHSPLSVWLLFLGAAPATLIPYFLYTLAVKRTSLTMMGLLHYIEPSLQFALALWVFHEPLEQEKLVSFGFIWLGLVICSIPALKQLIFRPNKDQGNPTHP